jgi:hypothetical protein
VTTEFGGFAEIRWLSEVPTAAVSEDALGKSAMPVIRIPEAQWGKVWRVLVASGPISRVSEQPVYLVSDRQVLLLRRKKLPFKLLPPSNGYQTGSRHG